MDCDQSERAQGRGVGHDLTLGKYQIIMRNKCSVDCRVSVSRVEM